MDELRNYLNTLEPGPVEETTHLERLLAEVWDDLGGDNGGMAGTSSSAVWNRSSGTGLS